jgi:nucleotide-binding universal stress UspA family protein
MDQRVQFRLGMALQFLVGIDFSDLSERALTQALRLAHQCSARLLLVHVASSRPFVRDGFATRARSELRAAESEERLARLCDEAKANGVAAEAHLVYGAAARSLLAEIELRHPDMVFVGSHGRTGLAKAWLGSVSGALCLHSPVPVVVVGDPGQRASYHEAL